MLRPITNDQDHEVALRELDRLWDGETTVELAELDALVTLVEAYERKRWPMDTGLDPIDVIKQAMTPDVGHTRRDLVSMIGSASLVSQVLARKRPLTLEMIRIIAERWGIPIAMLTPAYRLEHDPHAEMILGSA